MARASSGAWRVGFAAWLSACSVYDARVLAGDPSSSSSGSSGSAGAGGSVDSTGADVSSASSATTGEGTGGTAGASGTAGAGGAAGTVIVGSDASFDAPSDNETDRGPARDADANDGSREPAIDAAPVDAPPGDAIVANDTTTIGAVLEAYWRFDEGAGTMTADATGHGHTGTLQAGAVWQPGRIGMGSISVDSGAYVDVPEPVIDTLQPYSVAVWINFRRVTDPHQTIVSLDGTSISAFFLQLSGGRLSFYTKSTDSTTAGDFLVQAIDLALVNTWYHVVGVRDASRLTLYVNGVAQGSTAFTSVWAGRGSTAIGRGKWAGNLQDYVSGTIDDVRIYRGALTAQEVAALAALATP